MLERTTDRFRNVNNAFLCRCVSARGKTREENLCSTSNYPESNEFPGHLFDKEFEVADKFQLHISPIGYYTTEEATDRQTV